VKEMEEKIAKLEEERETAYANMDEPEVR